MSLIFIIILLAIGVALLIVEVVVLPGITFAGIFGVLLVITGLAFAFSHSSEVGIYSVIGTVLLFVALLVYALRSKTWNKLSLDSEIDSKVNVLEATVEVGQKGVTISRLAPIGKIDVNDKIMEAKSEFGLIDENKEVVIVQIDNATIIVQEIRS
jgi:membrane-bound ClpP family serine protease